MAFRVGSAKHRLDEPHQVIPQHGCIPAVPASVSPGKWIVAPADKGHLSRARASHDFALPLESGLSLTTTLRIHFEVGKRFGAVYAAPACGVVPVLGSLVAGTYPSAVAAGGHIVHVGVVRS
jgi:hypothetical protein